VIYLIAVTGMRFAECLGLTWDSVDYDNKLLNVNKTWNYKTNLDFSSTKTKSSIRKIPLDDSTLELLKSTDKIIGWKIKIIVFSLRYQTMQSIRP
jgi:phage integrase family prophage lambdaSa2